MKYRLVIDVLPSSTLSVDVRNGKNTIGHLVLSQTGLRWAKRKQKISDPEVEIPWRDVQKKLEQ